MDAAWIGVIGVLGGSALTLCGNVLNNYYLLRKEKQSRVWEREKVYMENENKHRAEKFKVYNAVLQEDGEHQYVREIPEVNTKFKDFDRMRYKQVMRPLLMPNLHLLADDVFSLVRQLDSYTDDDLNYIDHEEWYNDMANIYKALIAEIEKQYEERL
ncbi:hypothetical protein [Cohnella soli]|uniref:Uncharacterized protein n=1 Tax=Cohnella soli TaxID=425005 RepID=A0ABW0HM66_9BACL